MRVASQAQTVWLKRMMMLMKRELRFSIFAPVWMGWLVSCRSRWRPKAASGNCREVLGYKSKIVDMYDMCPYVHVDKASLALTQERRHSLAKINKAALSTPVGYMCSFCPKVIAQIKLHIRV